MSFTSVALAKKLNDLEKVKQTANLAPGSLGTMLITTATKFIYPPIAKNLELLDEEVGTAFKGVNTARDSMKQLAGKEDLDEKVLDQLDKLESQIDEIIKEAAASEKACRKALEQTMGNFQAQITSLFDVNEKAQVEGGKLNRFLVDVEVRLLAQLNRIKEMSEVSSQSKILAENARKQATGDEKSKHSDWLGVLDELGKLTKSLEGKTKQVATSLKTLERLDKLKEEDFDEVALNNLKRYYADGENALDLMDAALKTLKDKVESEIKQLPKDKFLEKKKKAAEQFEKDADQSVGNVYKNVEKYLNQKFFFTCQAKHKAYLKNKK